MSSLPPSYLEEISEVQKLRLKLNLLSAGSSAGWWYVVSYRLSKAFSINIYPCIIFHTMLHLTGLDLIRQFASLSLSSLEETSQNQDNFPHIPSVYGERVYEHDNSTLNLNQRVLSHSLTFTTCL